VLACLGAHVSERENGSMTRSSVNLDDLTPEEQLDLLEEIWDRLSGQLHKYDDVFEWHST